MSKRLTGQQRVALACAPPRGLVTVDVLTRDLSAAVRDLLGVEKVWCDTRTERSNQKFVLWAGRVLSHRCASRICSLAARSRPVKGFSSSFSAREELLQRLLLLRRKEFQAAVGGQKFCFSLLVHDDESAPEVDFLESSSVLQV